MRSARLVLGLTVGTLLLVALPLAAQNDKGNLKVKTNVGRAGVFVDGKYLGPAANFGFSRTYSLTAGEHEVTLTDPRHQEYSTKVMVNTSKTTVISQDLKPIPLANPPFGKLRTEGGSDKFAGVFVNGRYMGHVDEFSNPAQRLLLPPGDYKVKIVSPATGKEDEEAVTVEKDKTTTVRIKN